MVKVRKRHFWNNWITKVGEVNQRGPGESYFQLCFFFRFNDSHTYVPLLVKMMSLV